MPYNKSQRRATEKWEAQNYEQIKFTAPKGFKESIKEASAQSGMSMRKFIIEAIQDKMSRI